MNPLRITAIFLSLLVLSGCKEPIPHRMDSPEAAFMAASIGLRNHDMATYFDALTESAVRTSLENSAMICLAKNMPEAVAAGLKPSLGCEAILANYGWPTDGTQNSAGFEAAIRKVRDPRGLVRELEENHRRNDVGTSFVWEYLNGVKISDIVITGSKAVGMAEWGGDGKQPVHFEKDETGWRFDPAPELSH